MGTDLIHVKDEPGLSYYRAEKWKDLLEYIISMQEYSIYIWRGQSDASWELYSGFDRLFKEKKPAEIKTAAEQHLENFKYVSRGKFDFDPALEQSENEWWALGQHFGLKTPLLDWSFAPFVALYFAIHDQIDKEDIHCALWALGGVDDICERKRQAAQSRSGAELDETLVYRFLSKQRVNNRLISQNGLFTRAPYGVSVNGWIKDTSESVGASGYEDLIKIELTMNKKEIRECVTFLNKMNINGATLFPDLSGASLLCNLALQVDDYFTCE